MPGDADLPLRITGCRGCGAVQRLPGAGGRWSLASCSFCSTALERRNGRHPGLALAFASAGLVLLLPANLLPFLGTSIAGVSRHSSLSSSATAMLTNGFPELAVVVGLFVIVLPPLRLALLSAVLGVLQFGGGRRPGWLGPVFRVAIASPQLTSSLQHLENTLAQADRMMSEVAPQVGPLVAKLNRTADEATGTAAAARSLLGGEGGSPDANLTTAVKELSDAARSIRALADYLGRHPDSLIRGRGREAAQTPPDGGSK